MRRWVLVAVQRLALRAHVEICAAEALEARSDNEALARITHGVVQEGVRCRREQRRCSLAQRHV